MTELAAQVAALTERVARLEDTIKDKQGVPAVAARLARLTRQLLRLKKRPGNRNRAARLVRPANRSDSRPSPTAGCKREQKHPQRISEHRQQRGC